MSSHELCMQYTVTSQYGRGEEKWIASFDSRDNVSLFLSKKSSIDEEEGKKVIYRLYEDQELLQEWNKNSISVVRALYADGNANFDSASPGMFAVVINSINLLNKIPVAQFDEENNALLFIAGAFEAKNKVHADDVFFIFKDSLLVHTLNKSIMEKQKRGSSGVDDKNKGSTYQISPLSTRPTPGGGPPDYWVEKEADDE